MYQINEAKVAGGYNLHVWVDAEDSIEQLLEQFDPLTYVLYVTVVEPLAPYRGQFKQAVFVQVPSEKYAGPIRGTVTAVLGVSRL